MNNSIKTKCLISLTILSLNTPLLAQNVQYIEKATPAPYAGYLFPPAKAQDLRNSVLENEANKALVKSLTLSLDYKTQVIEDTRKQNTILTDSNDKLAKTAYQDHSLTNLERFGYFAAGVLATWGAIKLGQQAIK